jgi:VRR-NUC domain
MSGARHRRQRPEAAIHAAVCDHLRLRAKPDVLWLHPANGGTRDIREAARFKRMGVLAGASDLLLWHRGNSFALELKSPGGRLSDAQLEFLARFNDADGHVGERRRCRPRDRLPRRLGLLVGRRQ